jgi:hypothetical protein
VSLDNTLWFAGMVAEAAVLGLLLYRRVWKTFPIFCVYIVWVLLTDAANFIVHRSFLSHYLTIYLIETAVDSALEFGVLVELAWSVLRPIRTSLPRVTLLVVGILIVVAGAVIWPFAGIHELASWPLEVRTLVRMQQTASILRILFFLVLAGCSQLLSISWRDRELQVATGLGFYSFVSLGVAVMHSHQGLVPEYRYLNQVVVASYLLSFSYWIFSFAQKEAERREFTPAMQNFLLAMAGTARSTRISLAESSGSKFRNHED